MVTPCLVQDEAEVAEVSAAPMAAVRAPRALRAAAKPTYVEVTDSESSSGGQEEPEYEVFE